MLLIFKTLKLQFSIVFGLVWFMGNDETKSMKERKRVSLLLSLFWIVLKKKLVFFQVNSHNIWVHCTLDERMNWSLSFSRSLKVLSEWMDKYQIKGPHITQSFKRAEKRERETKQKMIRYQRFLIPSVFYWKSSNTYISIKSCIDLNVYERITHNIELM
jgi:antirestriction protein